MKLQRFFVGSAIEDRQETNIPSLELSNQLKNVLRLSEGDKVVLFDNSGYDFLSAIYKYQKDGVSFKILEKTRNAVRPERETYLFASIVKKDNFEWIVEKATELGVSHIIPLVSARTEKKNLNQERLTKVSIEAAEQSGRATLPVLHTIVSLEKALVEYAHLQSIAWDPSAEKFSANDMLTINGVYIGPEGGWSSEELEMFRSHGIHLHSLGPQILRAETAAIAVISRLVF